MSHVSVVDYIKDVFQTYAELNEPGLSDYPFDKTNKISILAENTMQ